MGRTKQYTDAAAKHRAYRARLAVETVRVDRRRWAALEGRANRLAEAVGQARAAGCEVAREIAGAATDTVLDSLIDWFQRRAAPAGRPETMAAASGAAKPGVHALRRKEGSATQQ